MNRKGLLWGEKEFPFGKLSVPEDGCTAFTFCFPAGLDLLPAPVLLKRRKRQFGKEVAELPGKGKPGLRHTP